MDHIQEPNAEFPFDKLSFVSPVPIPGGNHFIRCFSNGQQKPLYLQPPKCKIKTGIVKAGKRMYCDLIFCHDDETFIEWIDKFEEICQDRIYENREKWFESTLEKHDIENSFSPTMKLYKSGKLYTMRVNIPVRLGKCGLKIYNEQEEDVLPSSIQENTPVITILEFQGIKCSSRSFQLDIEVKQMMVLNPVDLFESCVFKKKATEPISTPSPIIPVNVKVEDVPEDEDENVSVLEEVEPLVNTPVEPQEVVLEELPQETLATTDDSDFCEVDIPLETISESEEVVKLKTHNEKYYEMYREAKRKAKIAKDFAIAAYLEAKRIKNIYYLDLDDDEEKEMDKQEKELEQIES
jgi:hypothetical protein